MLWRELQQRGDQGLQESDKRWLVLGLRAKDHDSRMGLGGYAWAFAKSRSSVINVQRHQHTIFLAATLGEHRIASTRRFLDTVSDGFEAESLHREGSARILL
jgi:hypothetical protein